MKEIKSDSVTPDQQFALYQVEKNRPAEFPVTLSDDDRNLLNVHQFDSVTKKSKANVYVHRTCEGELVAKFIMDETLFGDSYAIMYSECVPEKSEFKRWDEQGQPFTVTMYVIEEYEIEKVISPNW